MHPISQDLGEMLEWLKRHAWKACKPLKGFAGSNPALSAIILKYQLQDLFPFNVKAGNEIYTQYGIKYSLKIEKREVVN